MITREKFDSIKEKYGRVASWAIWAHEDKEPTSNMGDLTVLDPEINKNLNQDQANILYPNQQQSKFFYYLVQRHEVLCVFHLELNYVF